MVRVRAVPIDQVTLSTSLTAVPLKNPAGVSELAESLASPQLLQRSCAGMDALRPRLRLENQSRSSQPSVESQHVASPQLQSEAYLRWERAERMKPPSDWFRLLAWFLLRLLAVEAGLLLVAVCYAISIGAC